MTRNLALIALALLVPASTASACGRKCGCHHRRHRIAAPSVSYIPASYATPAYVAPAPQGYVQAAPAPAIANPAAMAEAPAVVPSYEYPTQPGAGGGYYYTYNDSGKLIIQEWGDWLFRGGRVAGMPRPPLPIIGNFTRR